MKKKTLGIIAASAFAIAAVSAPVAAAPSEKAIEASCFGQVHKTINTVGALGFTNVGDVVKAVGGQTKNEIARAQTC